MCELQESQNGSRIELMFQVSPLVVGLLVGKDWWRQQKLSSSIL